MLFEAVMEGAKLFHKDEPLSSFYDKYMQHKANNINLWHSADTLTLAEMDRLIWFVNQWRTHYPNSDSSQQALLAAITSAFPSLAFLIKEDLLHVDLSRRVFEKYTITDVIDVAFSTLAQAQDKNHLTAASKFLHTINPQLFVMWDDAIRAGYAVGDTEDYARRFLPRIQKVTRRAVAEYMQAYSVPEQLAVQSLCSCGHTLAKVIDEYNYTKFTLKRDEVWEGELTFY